MKTLSVLQRSILLLILYLVASIFSAQSFESVKVQIFGTGGNDVLVMQTLLTQTLSAEIKTLGLDVEYFPIESDYPKVIINALTAGTPPDAFYVNTDTAKAWIDTGKLSPLPTYLVEQTKNYPPELIELYSKNGQLYAMPKDMNALVLTYNKDVFDDANVEYPNISDTWLDFEKKIASVVNNIGDEGVTGACILPDYNRFAAFALSTGWTPINQQMRTVLDDNFLRAFEFYTGLVTKGLAKFPDELGQNWSGGCFGLERAAVTIEGAWLISFLNDKAPNLLYATTLLPKDPVTQKRGNIIFSNGWGVSVDAKYKKQTMRLVEHLVGKKAQEKVLELGLAVPTNLALMKDSSAWKEGKESELTRTVLQASNVDFIKPYAFHPYGNSWQEPINIALSEVMLGSRSIQEAVKDAQRRYDELYEKLEH